MKGIISFIKKETVLSVALLLAVVSAFFVTPDKEYVDYIDFRTLGILFCLMAVMAGFSKIGLFDLLAKKLLSSVKSLRGIVTLLILLVFIFAMFITNDVALITFVPLTIIVLKLLGTDALRRFLIPVVAMQTIAANLGSMMTPIGNPQNLYLFGQANYSLVEFIKLMLPYTLLALVLLMIWSFVFTRKETKAMDVNFSVEAAEAGLNKVSLVIYGILFLVCILTVARVIPYYITLIIVVLAVLIWDYKIFGAVDYALLFTFVGFFVFIGNMGRIEAFREFLQSVIAGRETVTAVISSQVMSNVPAALLLSGFSDQVNSLLIGVNLGGLGTLIASMASLISFKYIAREDKALRGKYLIYFTIWNVVFLGAEFVLFFAIK